MYQNEINIAKERLQKIISKAEFQLVNVPEGHLRISHEDKRIQYYHISEELPSCPRLGKYIPKKNRDLACQLAQKTYLEDIISTAKGLLKELSYFSFQQIDSILGECYSKLSPYRQEIITPLILSDEAYVQQWSQEVFRGNPFRTEALIFSTERGEYVRSKSEKMIADKLLMLGIPYKYEHPLQLKSQKTLYPDFTLLNISNRKEYYLEHLGMLDNPEYAQATVEKLALYAQSGIILGVNLILTYETQRTPLDMRSFEAVIQHFILNQPFC